MLSRGCRYLMVSPPMYGSVFCHVGMVQVRFVFCLCVVHLFYLVLVMVGACTRYISDVDVDVLMIMIVL